MAMLKGSVAGREAGALKKQSLGAIKRNFALEITHDCVFLIFLFSYFLIDGLLFVLSVCISLQTRFLAYHM